MIHSETVRDTPTVDCVPCPTQTTGAGHGHGTRSSDTVTVSRTQWDTVGTHGTQSERTTMTIDEFEDDWPQKFAETIRRAEQVKAERAAHHDYFTRRRHWGLKARHAAKLARQADQEAA